MLWLAIALFLIVAGAWALVLLLALPWWIGAIVTGLAILLFACVFVFRLLRARARAAALERELLRQAQNQAQNASPDRRPEILALQAQMKASIEALKRTKLGASGKSALYKLPWYAIIGPPAAGKTTALTQSGLGFITPAGSAGAKVRGTAGTRNCDWWFSEQAILLDTAGRLATEEDDRDEWLAFLDTVRRFRPDRPLDGIVIALSIEDIAAANDVALEETAKTLRARMDELMNRLEMVLPIYVLFTKVDLVPGFVEYWGELTKAQRAQAWGASFALDDPRLGEPARAVDAEFELLVGVLHARVFERLGREPLPEVRAKVLQFPLELQRMRQHIAHFVEELCRPNPYQETPLLRGFYFSSGTQTGRSLDRVIDNMARGFNMPQFSAPQASRAAQSQSYFVTDLFQGVVFPDRHLGIRAQSRVRRRLRRQALGAGAAMLGTLVVVGPAGLSYVENQKLLRSTSRDVQESLRLERGANATVSATAGALDLLVGRVQALESEKDEAQLSGLWGPYSAPKLHDAVHTIYLQRLRALVSGPVQEQLVSDVRAVGDLVRMDPENFQAGYDDLKLYLMLSRPQHLDPAWAEKRLADVWARALRSETQMDSQKLQAHARYYVRAVAADPTWAFKADEGVVARAQGRLAFLPIDELRYGWLLEAARGTPPIRPDTVFFGAAAQYFTARDNVEVPGLYTALGWQKVRALLDSPDTRFSLESWVLGQVATARTEERETNVDRLRDLYFQRYVRAWSDFIGGLDVQAPRDMPTALDELRALSESDGPYTRLFRTLSENVRLDIGPTSLVDKALDKGEKLADKLFDKAKGVDAGAPPARAISPVERHFEPLLRFAFGDSQGGKPDSAPSGLNQYLVHLTTLEVALSQLSEARAEPTREFEAELSRTAGAVQRLLGGLEPRTRRILEPLLMNPIRGSRAGVVRADYSALGEHWKADVWDAYNEKLAGRFPFVDAPGEVTIAEFAEFFRPTTGTLWKFYGTNLEARLDRSGNSFAPKPSADPMPFRPDFLRCLGVAQEITDAIFGAAPEPQVPFALKIHPVSVNIAEVAVIVDGTPTVYRNEPERWINAQWPGKGSPRGGTLRVRGAGFTDEIPRLGDFGLFRLLAAGNVKPSGALAEGVPVLVATWSLTRPGEPPVQIEIKPAKSTHPFTRDFFRRLKCPPEVVLPEAPAPRPGAHL